MCTLGKSSLIATDNVTQTTDSSYALSLKENVSLLSAKVISLTETSFSSVCQICELRQQTKSSQVKPVIKSNIWVTYGKMALGKKDKETIETGKYLEDVHITMAQYIVKDQFSNITNGLQSTSYQEKYHIGHENALRIIHTGGNHWSLISTLDCNEDEVKLYDSIYSSVSENTAKAIAYLLHYQGKAIKVKVMNVKRQIGAQDCGLFALAFLTTICNGEDPTTEVYDQEEMRPHLVNCFERKKMEKFPVLKKRRNVASIIKEEEIDIYCICRLPDDRTSMICCDRCQEWFHFQCVHISESHDLRQQWFCDNCSKLN